MSNMILYPLSYEIGYLRTVENLELLLSKYANDERVRVAAENRQSDQPVNLLIKGMVGAQESFVLSGSTRRSRSASALDSKMKAPPE